jgi:hypothetical protein
MGLHPSQGGFDLVDVGGRKLHLCRSDIFLEPVKLGGSRNGNDPWLFRQQPGRGDLPGGSLLLPGDAFDHVDEHAVGPAVLLRKARLPAPEVVIGERLRLVDLAGQEALAQRGERHESDAELLEEWQDFLLRLAVPERLFALECGDGLHGIRPPYSCCAGFRQTEMQHLSLGNQILDRAGDVFDRRVRSTRCW